MATVRSLSLDADRGRLIGWWHCVARRRVFVLFDLVDIGHGIRDHGGRVEGGDVEEEKHESCPHGGESMARAVWCRMWDGSDGKLLHGCEGTTRRERGVQFKESQKRYASFMALSVGRVVRGVLAITIGRLRVNTTACAVCQNTVMSGL